jgi:hypothetical protein
MFNHYVYKYPSNVCAVITVAQGYANKYAVRPDDKTPNKGLHLDAGIAEHVARNNDIAPGLYTFEHNYGKHGVCFVRIKRRIVSAEGEANRLESLGNKAKGTATTGAPGIAGNQQRADAAHHAAHNRKRERGYLVAWLREVAKRQERHNKEARGVRQGPTIKAKVGHATRLLTDRERRGLELIQKHATNARSCAIMAYVETGDEELRDKLHAAKAALLQAHDIAFAILNNVPTRGATPLGYKETK